LIGWKFDGENELRRDSGTTGLFRRDAEHREACAVICTESRSHADIKPYQVPEWQGKSTLDLSGREIAARFEINGIGCVGEFHVFAQLRYN